MVPLWRSVPSVSRSLTCRTSPVVSEYLFPCFVEDFFWEFKLNTNFDTLVSNSPVWYYCFSSMPKLWTWFTYCTSLIIAEKIVCVCSFTSKWAISGFTSWNCGGSWSIPTKCSGVWKYMYIIDTIYCKLLDVHVRIKYLWRGWQFDKSFR